MNKDKATFSRPDAQRIGRATQWVESRVKSREMADYGTGPMRGQLIAANGCSGGSITTTTVMTNLVISGSNATASYEDITGPLATSNFMQTNLTIPSGGTGNSQRLWSLANMGGNASLNTSTGFTATSPVYGGSLTPGSAVMIQLSGNYTCDLPHGVGPFDPAVCGEVTVAFAGVSINLVANFFAGSDGGGTWTANVVATNGSTNGWQVSGSLLFCSDGPPYTVPSFLQLVGGYDAQQKIYAALNAAGIALIGGGTLHLTPMDWRDYLLTWGATRGQGFASDTNFAAAGGPNAVSVSGASATCGTLSLASVIAVAFVAT